jgi:hypothetical protein
MNNGRKRGKKGRLAFTKKWNWRLVAGETYREDILKIAAKASGGSTNQRVLIGHYSRSLQEICDGLSDEEIDELRARASEWNEEGPPVEVKQR